MFDENHRQETLQANRHAILKTNPLRSKLSGLKIHILVKKRKKGS